MAPVRLRSRPHWFTVHAVAANPRRRALVALPLLLAVLVTGLYLLRTGLLEGPLEALTDYVQGHGTAGALAYGAIYVAWVVAMLPGFLLTMAAGVVYGPLLATAIVVPVQTLGVTLAFLSSRYLFRGFVEERLGEDPRFRAIDRAVDDRSFVLVLLLRLSPAVPYNVLNYALGATRVRLGPYVAGSFLGMIPGTFLYAYLGATLGTLGGSAPEDPVQQVVHWVGLGATVLVAVVATWIARNALKSAFAEAGIDPEGESSAPD